MLPFLEVSHIPYSSSFYSAATQPLGLRFISAGISSGSPSITYGFVASPPVPVFELRQVKATADRPLKLSRIVFSTACPEAVRDFQALVRRVKEEDRKSARLGDQASFRHSAEPEDTYAGKERTSIDSGKLPDKARETDIDGNIMEVAYVPPEEYPENYGGSTVRKTQSTHSEVSRILNWNYNVASSEPALTVSLAPLAPASPSLVSPRRPSRLNDEQAAAPRRGATHASSTTLYEPADPAMRLTSSGLLGTSTIGALMGVAAGAAIGAGITYGVMKTGTQDYDGTTIQRGTAYAEPPHYDSRGRYSEYERPVKEPQYREEYTSVADRRPPPTILTRYTHAVAAPGRSRENFDDGYEGRSRHSSRPKASGTSNMRARSETPTSRKPLLLADTEHRSYVTPKHGELEDVAQDHRGHSVSRHSSRSKQVVPAGPCSIRRSKTYHVGADGHSYVSARSQRATNNNNNTTTTTTTIRGAPPAGAQAELASRPAPLKTAGRPSAAAAAAALQGKPRRSNSYASAREAPLAGSRAANYMPAREVPLPASRSGMSYVPARHLLQPPGGGGGVHAEPWEDDLDSITPDDSISCVGARRSERLYR
ncbi:hypothetical protein VSDG_03428 [Cytospora chrysosperma]|uniref:Uncharacterized protein n=1 Tax=Cytospora chrysosperma TaxID=252740 RepID=A0A423W9U8_CYTCH|nr:hypothetical protein VSDG_03428 [Valsa sordida]